MITKQKAKTNGTSKNGTQQRTISIEFLDPVAASVSIAGTFNDWRHEVSPMISMGEGRWVKNLALEPGRYEYCLVVDGWKWVQDPTAQESVPNPFGGHNSVLRVNQSVK